MDHDNCASWLRIVKVKRGYLVRGCVRHSKKSKSGVKINSHTSSNISLIEETEDISEQVNEPIIESSNSEDSVEDIYVSVELSKINFDVDLDQYDTDIPWLKSGHQ